MTNSITFDGVTLESPRFESEGISYPANFGKTELQTGGYSLQGSTTRGFECKFRCYTDDHTDIENLIAKIGLVGDLVINSVTYPNVMIEPPITEVPIFPSAEEWFYYVNFTQGVIATAGIVVIDGGTP